MGIHYDYKSTRGEKAMKKEAKRKARIEERRARKGSDSEKDDQKRIMSPKDAINAGANDCISYNGEFHEIHCNKEEIYKVKKLLERKIDSFISARIEWMPLNFIEVNRNEKDEIISFLENLEDDDDVQNVYSNVKFNN